MVKKLQIGHHYRIKDTYVKPNKKYFTGVSNLPDDALRGKILKCFKVSGTGMSAWFRYNGAEFWIPNAYLQKVLVRGFAVGGYSISSKGNSKSTGDKFIITKPTNPPYAFWTSSMDQYVGKTVTITYENASKWVRVNVDNGGYLWDKSWLTPITKENKAYKKMYTYKKMHKLTLQEELANIDATYDKKIRELKWQSSIRKMKMEDKAESYENYLKTDKTNGDIDKYIASKCDTVKKDSMFSATIKAGLISLVVAAIGSGIMWGIISFA